MDSPGWGECDAVSAFQPGISAGCDEVPLRVHHAPADGALGLVGHPLVPNVLIGLQPGASSCIVVVTILDREKEQVIDVA